MCDCTLEYFLSFCCLLNVSKLVYMHLMASSRRTSLAVFDVLESKQPRLVKVQCHVMCGPSNTMKKQTNIHKQSDMQRKKGIKHNYSLISVSENVYLICIARHGPNEKRHREENKTRRLLVNFVLCLCTSIVGLQHLKTTRVLYIYFDIIQLLFRSTLNANAHTHTSSARVSIVGHVKCVTFYL